MRRMFSTLALVLFASPAAAVTIDWVVVGDPGNPADDTHHGAVAEVYEISAYEITNAQYTEFLNAVADADPNALYSEQMESSPNGGIDRSGSSGSYAYQVKSGFADRPVNFISFYDALRFANWMYNDQPMGPQGDATTEDGAYTITAAGIADNSITRNPGEGIFLTSEDEWYKAAYWGAADEFWFEFPLAEFMAVACDVPGGTPATANCDDEVGSPTDVGSYPATPGPWGTFDQGGNIFEWTELILGDRRRLRGGAFDSSPITLRATIGADAAPIFEDVYTGFRVSSVPEPTSWAGSLAALLALATLARQRGIRLSR